MQETSRVQLPIEPLFEHGWWIKKDGALPRYVYMETPNIHLYVGCSSSTVMGHDFEHKLG
jgi:hypothetical protein